MESLLVFLAVLVAFWTLLIQRQHNRKQMLPVIHTYYSHYYEGDEKNEYFELKLFNDGHGVAILKSASVKLPDGEIVTFGNSIELSNFVEEQIPSATQQSTSLPFAVRGNSQESIYKVSIPKSDQSKFSELRFTFVAESIYGDVAVADETGFSFKSNPVDAYFDKMTSFMSRQLLRLTKSQSAN
ncbi:hypothetical protein [Vibrio vulnificus]|uniref:hypothetical protein n=1 Tax=Vibrio vulnificus TaxID=672 RepID=UPI0019D48DE0|nr:hypothetical protein [Vibrio vulnificus]MBN8035070.1 hypothetical protein [Vibrio vulnificus]